MLISVYNRCCEQSRMGLSLWVQIMHYVKQSEKTEAPWPFCHCRMFLGSLADLGCDCACTINI